MVVDHQVKATVDATVHQFGQRDVLVNNAGPMIFYALGVQTLNDLQWMPDVQPIHRQHCSQASRFPLGGPTRCPDISTAAHRE